MANPQNSHSYDEMNRSPQDVGGSPASPNDNAGNPQSPQVAAPSPASATRAQVVSMIKTLSEMKEGVEADCFVQLVEKEKLRSRDSKFYFKLVFRDRKTSVQALVWSDHYFFPDCDKNWTIGSFFKIRGKIVESSYGLRLEIRRIREIGKEDLDEGFNPRQCQPSPELPPEEIVAAILSLASKQIGKGSLLSLVQRVFKEFRLELYGAAASRTHHRTYGGGLLEHTLSVTKLAVAIYDHFNSEFPLLATRASKPLVVAGAILHDVGKILDCKTTLVDSQKTLAGNLIGHQILGLEIIRRIADEVRLEEEIRYRLEHLILTHSRFPEWGSPTPPETIEAMILHYADYADSTLASALKILEEDVSAGDLTFKKGPFGVPLVKLHFDPSPSKVAADLRSQNVPQSDTHSPVPQSFESNTSNSNKNM